MAAGTGAGKCRVPPDRAGCTAHTAVPRGHDNQPCSCDCRTTAAARTAARRQTALRCCRAAAQWCAHRCSGWAQGPCMLGMGSGDPLACDAGSAAAAAPLQLLPALVATAAAALPAACCSRCLAQGQQEQLAAAGAHTLALLVAVDHGMPARRMGARRPAQCRSHRGRAGRGQSGSRGAAALLHGGTAAARGRGGCSGAALLSTPARMARCGSGIVCMAGWEHGWQMGQEATTKRAIQDDMHPNPQPAQTSHSTLQQTSQSPATACPHTPVACLAACTADARRQRARCTLTTVAGCGAPATEKAATDRLQPLVHLSPRHFCLQSAQRPNSADSTLQRAAALPHPSAPVVAALQPLCAHFLAGRAAHAIAAAAAAGVPPARPHAGAAPLATERALLALQCRWGGRCESGG